MKLTTFLSIVIAETILTIVCILAIGFIAGCIREERREDGEWPQIRRVPSSAGRSENLATQVVSIAPSQRYGRKGRSFYRLVEGTP